MGMDRGHGRDRQPHTVNFPLCNVARGRWVQVGFCMVGDMFAADGESLMINALYLK